MNDEKCPGCVRVVEGWLEWRTFGNGTRHISVTCSDCGKWLRWAPQDEEAISRARPEGTAAAAQADLLK
jgi:endogenous inhibitor of DNA gyrase (YacG/DUF329 family)